jgi:2-succinyl-5-enolpyruvyl-6-hydroxy-3-cyclohexene-1-carboxylate synthase
VPGLRVGLAEDACTSGDSSFYPSFGEARRGRAAVVHHMDHLLLEEGVTWRALRPDVVLQLGGRLTSKRLATFLEWAALEGCVPPSPGQACSAPVAAATAGFIIYPIGQGPFSDGMPWAFLELSTS